MRRESSGGIACLPRNLPSCRKRRRLSSVLFDRVAVWLAIVASSVEKTAKANNANRMPKARSAVFTGSISVPPKPSWQKVLPKSQNASAGIGPSRLSAAMDRTVLPCTMLLRTELGLMLKQCVIYRSRIATVRLMPK